jgi:hypothetical protein
MTKEEIIIALQNMTDEEREEVLNHFCGQCHDPIDKLDWTGSNLCIHHSPDPDFS